MNSSAIFFICFAFIFLRTGTCLVFEDCCINGEISSLTINNCLTVPCRLQIGSTANMTVEFTSDISSNDLTQRAYFIISDVENDAIVQPNACNALEGTTCPLRQGVKTVYKAQVKISSNTPPVKGELIWMLMDQYDQIIVCFATDVRLVHNLNSVQSDDENEDSQSLENGEESNETVEKLLGHPRQRIFRSN